MSTDRYLGHDLSTVPLTDEERSTYSDEMTRAHREDSQAQRAADEMVRQIDAFLDQHPPSPRTRDLLEQTRDALKRLSAHLVAVWD